MKKKLISAMLCMAMTASMILTGCGGGNNSTPSDTSKNEATNPTQDDGTEEVTLTLGIWPEDTLTDDIKVYEGKGSECNMCAGLL